MLFWYLWHSKSLITEAADITADTWRPPINCTPTGAGIPDLPEHLMKYNEYGALTFQSPWCVFGLCVASPGPLRALLQVPDWQWTQSLAPGAARARSQESVPCRQDGRKKTDTLNNTFHTQL
jgi:hypothetical protein